MKYRGFKIEVKKADEGYCMTIYRLSDGWILADEWNPSINTKSEAIEECKLDIDDYYENPEAYED